MSEYMIPIPSRVYNAAVDGHVAGANQIIDDKTGLTLDKVAGGALEEKEYTSSSNNGMGRVVLRKHLVEGVNTLTQSMINKSNTIYIIQYEFTLGEDITIPANCILKFDGGSINGNHILTGNNTKICGTYFSLLSDINGTFDKLEIDYFISNRDSQSSRINKVLDLARNTNTLVSFSPNKYIVDSTIIISKLSIDGNGAVLKGTMDDESAVVKSLVYKQYQTVKNLTIDCNDKNNIGFDIFDANDININNINILNVKYLGIKITGGAGIYINNFKIIATADRYDYCRGIYSTKPDCKFTNGMIEFCAIGIDTVGGDFINIHCWGIPTIANTYINILHRHTPIRITNFVFDSPLSKIKDDTKNPEYIITDNGDFSKQVFKGGCGLLNLMDGSSTSNCSFTYNENIDTLQYDIPIGIRNIGHYSIMDSGSTRQFKYNIKFYSFSDNSVYYKSILRAGEVVNGTPNINNGIGSIAISGNYYGSIFNKSINRLHFNCYLKLFDFTSMTSWTASAIKFLLYSEFGYINDINICVYKKTEISINDIKVESSFELPSKFNIKVDDEGLYLNNMSPNDNYRYIPIPIAVSSNTNCCFIIGGGNKGTTEIQVNTHIGDTRPSYKYVGFQFYDTTINKSIWWNGSAWIDATGTQV